MTFFGGGHEHSKSDVYQVESRWGNRFCRRSSGVDIWRDWGELGCYAIDIDANRLRFRRRLVRRRFLSKVAAVAS